MTTADRLRANAALLAMLADRGQGLDADTLHSLAADLQEAAAEIERAAARERIAA